MINLHLNMVELRECFKLKNELNALEAEMEGYLKELGYGA